MVSDICIIACVVPIGYHFAWRALRNIHIWVTVYRFMLLVFHFDYSCNSHIFTVILQVANSQRKRGKLNFTCSYFTFFICLFSDKLN